MALRFMIPEVRVPDGYAFPAEEKPLMRGRAPPMVEFRSGGKLDDLIARVDAARVVRLSAPMGAGKSTRFPAELARQRSVLVVVVLPSVFMAAELAAYTACVHADDPTSDLPVSGVVYMSAACLVARWIVGGAVDMPRCYLLLDEVHESDCYTYFIRSVVRELTSVLGVVMMSATFGVDGFARLELPREVRRAVVAEHKMPARWSADDEGSKTSAPWASISDNALLFVDDVDAARRLVGEYVERGLYAYHLHSRMSLQRFQEAMSMMRSGRYIVVLIADNAFRSSFTFDVSTVVDSCLVRQLEIEAGSMRTTYRSAYELEAHQAMGRVGRTAGGSIPEYYRLPGDLPTSVCGLERQEMEAAVLLFRHFGYVVPRELQSTHAFSMDTPRNLVKVLRADMPVALMPDSEFALRAYVAEQGSRSPFLKPEHGGVRASSPTSVKASVTTEQMRQRDAQARTFEFDGALKALMLGDDDVTELHDTKCYSVDGVVGAPRHSRAVPDGADSVLYWLEHGQLKQRVSALSGADRLVALSAVVSRHNTVVVRREALKQVIATMSGCDAGMNRVLLREWAVGISHEMQDLDSQISAVGKSVHELAHNSHSLTSHAVPGVNVQAYYDRKMAEWRETSWSGFVEPVFEEVVEDLPMLSAPVRERICSGSFSPLSDEAPSYPRAVEKGRGMRRAPPQVEVSSWLSGLKFNFSNGLHRVEYSPVTKLEAASLPESDTVVMSLHDVPDRAKKRVSTMGGAGGSTRSSSTSRSSRRSRESSGASVSTRGRVVYDHASDVVWRTK